MCAHRISADLCDPVLYQCGKASVLYLSSKDVYSGVCCILRVGIMLNWLASGLFKVALRCLQSVAFRISGPDTDTLDRAIEWYSWCRFCVCCCRLMVFSYLVHSYVRNCILVHSWCDCFLVNNTNKCLDDLAKLYKSISCIFGIHASLSSKREVRDGQPIRWIVILIVTLFVVG